MQIIIVVHRIGNRHYATTLHPGDERPANIVFVETGTVDTETQLDELKERVSTQAQRRGIKELVGLDE